MTIAAGEREDKVLTTKPHALLVAMIDLPAEDEDELNAWYEEHALERLACPGFISCRRFVAVEGEPKFVAIYELEGLEALETSEYAAVRANQNERSKKLREKWTKLVRNVYEEIPTSYSATQAAD
jgi:hypothetical protein